MNFIFVIFLNTKFIILFLSIGFLQTILFPIFLNNFNGCTKQKITRDERGDSDELKKKGLL